MRLPTVFAVSALLAGCSAEPVNPPTAEASPEATPTPEPAPSGPPSNARADRGSWFIDRGSAAFGQPDTDAPLTFACVPTGGGARSLQIEWTTGAAADPGTERRLDLKGNGANTLVMVTAEDSETGHTLWAGEVTERGRMATVLESGEKPVEIGFGDGQPIRPPTSQRVADFIRRCGAA